MRALWHIETLAATAIALAAFFVAWPAGAQTAQYCGKRAEVTAYVTSKYQEQQRGVGLVSATILFELFVSPSGTWTMFATRPDGLTCLVGSGEDWQFVAPPPPERKSNPS